MVFYLRIKRNSFWKKKNKRKRRIIRKGKREGRIVGGSIKLIWGCIDLVRRETMTIDVKRGRDFDQSIDGNRSPTWFLFIAQLTDCTYIYTVCYKSGKLARFIDNFLDSLKPSIIDEWTEMDDFFIQYILSSHFSRNLKWQTSWRKILTIINLKIIKW